MSQILRTLVLASCRCAKYHYLAKHITRICNALIQIHSLKLQHAGCVLLDVGRCKNSLSKSSVHTLKAVSFRFLFLF